PRRAHSCGLSIRQPLSTSPRSVAPECFPLSLHDALPIFSNVTILYPDGIVSGFDTGPGNTLMDNWIKLQQGRNFDQNGEWAAQGDRKSTRLNSSHVSIAYAVVCATKKRRANRLDVWLIQP